MLMRRLISSILSIITLASFASETNPSVGLVLSGGGAKGIAHIGVIQALEDNDIPIDYITGTSMGAIVGGLYAAGYTPAEMMELIGSKGFTDWSTGQIDEKLEYFFLQPDPTPALFLLNLGENDSAKVAPMLPTSLINPLPMNFAFMELFSAYTAQCDENFDNLFVPFRCVTSDVYAKHKVVMSGGSLGDAVRMSMSFPVVFQPIELNGIPMYDGGIYDNFPVDVMMTEFAPDAVIGVTVASPSKPDSRNMLDQLESMIMQPNDFPFPDDRGIKIHINLEQFGLLDFPKYKEIYAIGYKRGMEMIDSIKTRIPSRVSALTRDVRRAAFKSATPYVVFDSVTVTGGSRNQNEYLRSLFPHSRQENGTDTFGLARAKEAYYRAITPGKLLNFIPKADYDPADSIFSLHLRAVVKDRFRVGLGGYISSSTNSMLFLTGGYNTLSYHSLNTQVKLWVGQSYLAALGSAEIMLPTATPASVALEIEASQQKFHEAEKLFFEANAPNFITKSEVFTRLLYKMATGRRDKAEIGVGYGHLTDRFYPKQMSTDAGRDHGIFDLGQVMARWEYNTLDNQFNPTGGARYIGEIQGVGGRFDYRSAPENDTRDFDTHPVWVQGQASALNYYDIGRHFAIGTEFNLLLSTRKLLPSYDASIVAAQAFHPTPSSYNSFNPAFRANSFATAGIIPVWKLTSTVQFRGNFHAFMPLRKIEYQGAGQEPVYGRWLSNPEFFGEIAAVVSLPFASISAYGNYTSSPSANWNLGISIGFFLLAPRFLGN